ncbi:hypothetical protein GCM10010498_28130 [Streptomyces cavourensis]|nr:hypothetical protein GCM10010498_28130 [Streptomyces cavourensis]
MPYERLTGLGEAHLAPGPDEQGGAGGGFQGLHLLAHRGLGAAELTGGGGERAGGGDGTQDAEVAGFDHPSTIRDAWMVGELMAYTFEV